MIPSLRMYDDEINQKYVLVHALAIYPNCYNA